ncbi:MAG: RNA polymerase sigma factor [Bacteroidota bacterium]
MDSPNPDFESIHAAYRSKIRDYLACLAGEQDAEDLTQEVFLKISRALGTFRGESRLSTWIYRIATNTALDRLRNDSRLQMSQWREFDESREIEAKELWTGEKPPSIEQQLLRRERTDCFIEYVRNLPPGYRTVVVLSELEGMPNSEIAEILGLSLDVVKIRLHRGRARLLQELRENCKPEDWLE